jgi:hypothetical protein
VSGGVTATGTTADAIDGNSSAAWAISNAGTICSLSGYGVNLAGQNSNVRNSGSISGGGEVNLSNDGSVTNTAKGAITATGGSGSTLATVSGIYVTGTGMNAISVTNAGVVTAAFGYGIGLGANGRVNNSGKVTGGEDGVVVVAGAGNIQNSGVITATLDDGVSLFQGGTVRQCVGWARQRPRSHQQGRIASMWCDFCQCSGRLSVSSKDSSGPTSPARSAALAAPSIATASTAPTRTQAGQERSVEPSDDAIERKI